MDKFFFSVIIPTFNRAQTIERAVKSVLAQSFTNFELIIVDDGSTDKTKEILSKYDLAYIYQDNRGVAGARNTGIEKSRGSWIALLDSDDEWLPDKLQKQYEYILEHPNINGVHGNEAWIRDGALVKQMSKHKKGGGDQFLASLKLCVVSPSCVVLRRDTLTKLGCFDEQYTVCEDYDLWLKFTSRFEIGFIPDILTNKYGGHDDQLSFKYIAMDYWRVKAIDNVLRENNLNQEKKEAAIDILLKKSKRLLKGYIKHNNLTHYDEINQIEKGWSV